MRALFHLYRCLLRLYPPDFRGRYAEQIATSVRDACAEASRSRIGFWPFLFLDLIASAVEENTRMLQNYFVRNPLITQSLLFSLFATFVAFTGYAVMHVSLRRGANEPQVQMAADAVAALGSGKQAEQAIPAGRVDLRRSLQPFVIFYDENGRVVTSSLEVVLDGRTPAPPSGVFAYARKFGENRLTWQPSPGVRIAAEMRYVAAAPQPGFVLAGRSLKTTERGDDLLFRLALLGWLAMLGAALSSVLLLHRSSSV